MEYLATPLCCLGDISSSVSSCLDHVPVIRAILAVVLIFFVPGLAWSFVFFSSKQVNFLERAVISVGLSIALVTLSMFALNLALDVQVTGTNAVLDIIVITLIAAAFYLARRFIKSRRGSTSQIE
ncbi:MAG: DUF1616 domain-containing protein [Dehalococcoidia bacterium]